MVLNKVQIRDELTPDYANTDDQERNLVAARRFATSIVIDPISEEAAHLLQHFYIPPLVSDVLVQYFRSIALEELGFGYMPEDQIYTDTCIAICNEIIK